MLSDSEILGEYKKGNIVIDPFNEDQLSPNSYDVTLGDYYFCEKSVHLGSTEYNVYSEEGVRKLWGNPGTASLVDGEYSLLARLYPNLVGKKVICIQPGQRLLCHTNEYIGGKNVGEYGITTMLKTRSSVGRTGISICLCAGSGDVGYTSRWTLEVTNHSSRMIPLVAGMRIGQILFFKTGKVLKDYSNGKYNTPKEKWSPYEMLPKLYKDFPPLPKKESEVQEEISIGK